MKSRIKAMRVEEEEGNVYISPTKEVGKIVSMLGLKNKGNIQGEERCPDARSLSPSSVQGRKQSRCERIQISVLTQ